MSEPAPDPGQDPRAELFRSEYARRRRRQRIADATLITTFLILGGSVFVCAVLGIGDSRYLGPLLGLVFLLVLVTALFQFINNRCPCCNKGQARIRNPRFCYNCGTRFRD